ncbi:MAG: SDR family oxidoreductase [Candidatus Omnitrophota bacterium]
MKRDKKIFITGATGFLGSNLIPKFIENGYGLKLLVRAKKDNPKSRLIQSLSNIYSDPLSISNALDNIEVLEGDVIKRDFGLSENNLRFLSQEISDIFHCAAAVSFDEEKENVVRKNNIEGTKNMLSFAEKIPNVHLHYMSTAYVCGQKSDMVKEKEVDLGQQFNNSYESSKCEAEILVRNWAAKCNSKVTIYRPSIIIGDSKTGKTQSNFGLYGILRIVDITVRGFKSKYNKGHSEIRAGGAQFDDGNFYIPLRAIGRREKTLNLVTIDYVSEVIMRIFKNKHNVGKTYHITNSHPPTMGLLKDCICETLKVSGIKFVLPEVFAANPIKSWERLLNKNIHIYTPYLLLKEAFFDDTNTQEVLKNSHIRHAKLDRQLIMKLLAYSYPEKSAIMS